METRYVGWGAGIVDLDNDGFPDLFVVTGSVYPEVEQKLPDYPLQDAAPGLPQSGRRQIRRVDRRSRARALPHAHSSRGCAFGDFDNDGDIDILIMNMNEPPSLLRNDCQAAATG